MDSTTAQATNSSLRLTLGRSLIFLLLVVLMYTFPEKPAMNLDASWRMALGKFFLDGLQFGTDVVFTYGPLGFLMGKTYYGSGTLYKLMLGWQLVAALGCATIIMMWGERLQAGAPRFFFYGFFLLFGATYEDALHMLIIAIAGFELLHRLGQPWKWTSFLLIGAVAVLGNVKFTNLMLGAFVVALVSGHELWHRRFRDAGKLLGTFVGVFLLVWIACRQNPLNLPAYFANSWNVSQGYQLVMGIATPPEPFWKAVVTVVVLAVYALVTLFTHADRPRTFVRVLLLGGFVYMNWKHGFVRSDGHMIGFFYCALLPIVAFPLLLDDGQLRPRLRRWALIPIGLLCLVGIRDTLPGLIDYGLGIFQTKVWKNIGNAATLPSLRDTYTDSLAQQRNGLDMPRTRAVIGDSPIDVMGYDQAAALFNKFNYQPRPVIQSYSVYTRKLAQLNADFYASDRAPEFALVRMSSIDDRLPAMDDSAALYVLAHRYHYVLSEQGYQLWQKNPGPFDLAAIAPKPLAAQTMKIDEPWLIEAHADQALWVQIDLRPSLLGRLRNFLYKPPMIYLDVQDSSGATSSYRMPAPMGQAGFILNPLIADLAGYVNFASHRPERKVRQIKLNVAPQDRKYFAASADAQLSTLVYPTTGRAYYENLTRERFHMFKSVPIAFEAQAGPSEEVIGTQPVLVIHAPSQMTFDVPKNATRVSGQHGFLVGAYTRGGDTNGADFVIVWSDGQNSREVYRRFLDPVRNPEDRGLVKFDFRLEGISGGRLYFKTLPGPYNLHSWDWTAWTGISID